MAGAAGKLGSKLAAKLFDAFSETMTDAAAKSQSKKAAESIKKGKELNKKAANAIKNLGNTKREREIKRLFKEGQGEGLGETKQAKIQIDPDTGRPTSKVIKKGGGFQIEKKTGGPVKLPPNPGAAALPTNVRNKMGFLKKGGSIAKRKAGGKIVKKALGGGVALRGHGAVRKV